MKWMKLIVFTLCISAAAGMFSYMISSSYGSSIRKTKILHDSDTMVSMAGDSYYLKMQGEEIVIYENNDVIFEYTDLDPELLPADVLTEVKKGIPFQNQKELYEFLETYTS